MHTAGMRAPLLRALTVIALVAASLSLLPTSGASAALPAGSDLSVALTAGPTRLDLGGGTARLEASVGGTKGSELDGFTMTLPSGARVVPKSATWGGAAVPDPVETGGHLVFTGPFVVGTDTLGIDVTFDATPGDRVVTLLGNLGKEWVGNAPTPTDGSNPATATVNVDTQPTAAEREYSIPPDTPLSINTAGLVSDPDGDAWILVDTTPAKHGAVSVVRRIVTYSPDKGFVGFDGFTYTVDDGRGGTATRMIHLTVDPAAPPPSGPKPQTIEFPPPPDLPAGGSAAIRAGSSSGLAITFTTSTPKVCRVEEARIIALSVGECSVTASQDGNDAWEAAEPVTMSFRVTDPDGRSPQWLDFAQPGPVAVGDAFGALVVASSKLAVVLTSETPEVCVVKGLTVIARSVGKCSVTASQAGDDTWAPAEPITRTFTVSESGGRVPQSIDFAQPDPLVLGDAFTAGPTASSKLEVVLTSETPEVCVVKGLTVVALSVGDCAVTAAQAGDDTWAPADPVTRTFTVSEAAGPIRAPQGIDFAQPGPLTVGHTLTVGPTASSKLTVVVTSETPGVCTVEGVSVAALSVGECSITASQDGDDTWAPADPVTRTFTITEPVPDRSRQHLEFVQPDPVTVGDAFTVQVASTSQLDVVLTSESPDVCTVQGLTVTTLTVGTCVLTVTQAGDGTWAPADPVTREVAVQPIVPPPPPIRSPQSIGFAQPDPVTVGDTFLVDATATSKLAVVVTSETPEVCSVDGMVVTTYLAGACVLTATQPGDETWAVADPVTREVAVQPILPPPPPVPSPQSIGFPQPGPVTVGDTFLVEATATSGLDVVATSETPEICTVAGPTVTQRSTTPSDGLTATTLTPGTCRITVTQPGDDLWAPADPVTREVTVDAVVPPPPDPEPQSIDFAQPDPVTVGDTFAVEATATSGLGVVVTSETPEICTVAGPTVTLRSTTPSDGLTATTLTAGSCRITVTQPGDDTWAPADPVTREVTVDPLSQTIDFRPVATVLGLTPGYQLPGDASSGLPVTLEVTAGDCTLDEGSLFIESAGTCTVTATQPGNDVYAAAEPVSADIEFVLPADDVADTPGAAPVLVDVLANDPSGAALDNVSPPAHGTAAVVGSQVRYTPEPAFRGTDTFTYTITREERSALARVTVTVANQAPRLAGAHLEQLAGTEATVLLRPTDPNGDPVTLRAATGNGGVEVSLSGNELTVAAAPAASGDAVIRVRGTDGEGASVVASVRTRISPLAATHVRRTLSDDGTTVQWRPAPTTGAVYETTLDGDVLCHSPRPVCTSGRIAGPLSHVTVRTLGRDSTSSAEVDAPLVGHGRVVVTTVHFASGSDHLTDRDRDVLDLTVRAIQQDGFEHVHLDGYTDSAGGRASNLVLSKRRTRAVAAYLGDRGHLDSDQAWHGEADPAAPNTSDAGRARNRRVEVVLTW